MQNILEMILADLNGTISLPELLLSVAVACVIALFILLIYRKTYTGVVYSNSFAMSIILLSMVTSIITCTISSNMALSLGMVGALSIVRFRTAVKEPIDTGFMFWGISAGIMAGAGLYLIAIIASIVLGVLYFFGYLWGFKGKSKYLFVLKYNKDKEEKIEKLLKDLPKCKLKTKTISKNVTELTYEIEVTENKTDFMNDFTDNEDIIVASLISYQNEFGD